MKSANLQWQRGSIPLVMILVLALCASVAAVTSYVDSSSRRAAHAESEIKAMRAAEAALEINMARLNEHAISIRPATPNLEGVTTQCNLSTAPTGLFPTSAGYTFKSNIAVPIENGVPVTQFGTTSNATMTYNYVSSVVVTHKPAVGAPATVSMQRAFTHQVIPLFQYAIFYDGVLELNPGEDFTVGGRVHSNTSFYYASSKKLTFRGIVTAVTKAVNSRNPLDPRTGNYGNDATFANGTPPVRPYTVGYIPFPCSTVNTSNVNQSGPIEFIEMPDTSVADPNALDREYSLAGLKILVNTSSTDCTINTIQVKKRNLTNKDYGFVLLTQDGTPIPPKNQSNPTLSNGLYLVVDDILGNLANKTIRDYRQTAAGTDMNITEINVNKLTDAVDGGGTPAPVARILPQVPNDDAYGAAKDKLLWNGIVYVHDVSRGGSTPSRPVAIALVNGSNLPTTVVAPRAPGGGLTIVTDHPAYIIGDYNTGGTGDSVPVNVKDSSLSASPTVSGYTVRPAAVMADAVTILSRNWLTGNYNSKASSTGRIPVNTTINAAILAGNVPSTSPGHYSGGAENFPRLLEHWSGVRLTFYGSMICLYVSRQANIPWNSVGTYYNAATRNWYFEPTFNNPNRLPPGTPNAISFSNGEWVRF